MPVINSLPVRFLPMVCGDQPYSFQIVEQISSFALQDLESPFLVRFDLGNLQDDAGKLSDPRVFRCSEGLKPLCVFVRNVRLVHVAEDLLLLFGGVPFVFWHPGAVFAYMGPMAFAGELLIRSYSTADSAVMPHLFSFGYR